ncbi:MAG: hypothetical protein RLN86_10535 [Cyclobacteriaceae bacterium]
MVYRLAMPYRYLLSAMFTFLATSLLFGQGERPDKTAVTYEELYDEPYSVNKLFIGFQPLYGEAFATNVNAGFGIDAAYYHQDKADFRAHFRKTYSSSFYDLNRDLASKNSSVSNTPQSFNYFEVGGTYHWKDEEVTSKTKMVLYKKSYSANKWAGRVPLTAEVPAKVRKIYGARLGAILWNSTADIDRVLEKQNLTHADLINGEGVGLPDTFVNPVGQTQDLRAFSNISSAGLYVGVSSAWIRNVAVSFDSYEEAVDDGMLTLFLDVLYSPGLSVDDIKYLGDEFSVDAIKTNPLGFRFGIDGKFNRTLSWSYGGELGYRPSFDGRGFFAMFRISFPVFGTNLDYKVEAFGQ